MPSRDTSTTFSVEGVAVVLGGLTGIYTVFPPGSCLGFAEPFPQTRFPFLPSASLYFNMHVVGIARNIHSRRGYSRAKRDIPIYVLVHTRGFSRQDAPKIGSSGLDEIRGGRDEDAAARGTSPMQIALINPNLNF